MFELVLYKSRTAVYDINLYTEDGVTGVSLDTGDKVRLILYRRASSTPLLNLLSGASPTANGSKVEVTTTVPTPSGSIPTIRLSIGQGDLATAIGGAPLVVELIVLDHDGVVTDALIGPILGLAYVTETSSAAP